MPAHNVNTAALEQVVEAARRFRKDETALNPKRKRELKCQS